MALVVKNPPANAGDAKDVGSNPRLERYPGVGNDSPRQIVHGQRRLVVLQSMGSQRGRCDRAHRHTRQLSGHELEQTLGNGEGQGRLACSSPWGCKESDMTEQLNNNT